MDKFNTIIDTLEVRTNVGNMNYANIEEIEDNTKVIKKPRFNSKAELLIPISINRGRGRYGRVESLKNFNVELEEFFVKVLEIQTMEDVKLNRLDIAIDCDLVFQDNFKYLLYMYSLILHSDKYANSWTTISHKDYKPNTLHSKSTNMDIVFYDKSSESEGKAPYNTRMEFRAKNLSSMDFEKHIDRVIGRINEMDINIPMLNKVTIEKICSLYDSEIATGEVLSFNEFVRKYNHLIFNKEILQSLYSYAGLKGNLTNWIKKFRTKTQLKLFTKTDTTNFQKECIKSLKHYRNN